MDIGEKDQSFKVTEYSEKEQKDILKKRAIALSHDIVVNEKKIGSIDITEFLMAGERYGIETSFVDEVHPFNEFTVIPCTPQYIFGIMNVRGKIISIVNLKVFFDLQDTGTADFSKTIIIHNEQMEFAILADEILGVRKVELDTIQTPLATLTGIHSDFLKGITIDRLIVLDGEKLLTNEELIVHEEV